MPDQFTNDEVFKLTEALFLYFRGRGESWHDAEDLVQEVLMQLCRKHAIAEVRRPRALAFTIAKGLGVDQIRWRTTRRDKHDEIAHYQAEIQRLADEPIESVDVGNILDFIRASIDKQKEPLREFLNRTLQQGASNNAALAAMGIDEPEARWKKRRSRFIASLREQLADNL